VEVERTFEEEFSLSERTVLRQLYDRLVLGIRSQSRVKEVSPGSGIATFTNVTFLKNTLLFTDFPFEVYPGLVEAHRASRACYPARDAVFKSAVIVSEGAV